MSPFYYVALLLLLCVCGFTSSAEMAFASANRVRLEHQAEEGVKAARIACRVYDRYDEMLSSILILNDLGNVLVSSLTSVIAINHGAWVPTKGWSVQSLGRPARPDARSRSSSSETYRRAVNEIYK